MKTVVILSGGMDSTTMLYKLKDEGRELQAISFDYGQRHKLELTRAAKTCNKLKIPHKIIDVSFLKELISNSALTNDSIDVPEGHYADENMKNTVVPNRNMIMLSIAIGYAVNLGFDSVAIGVHAGDHAIYPDCRPLFVHFMNDVAQIANYEAITVEAPFLEMDKGDIAKLGKKLGVDYSSTLTCYKGKAVPCGKCGACVERKEAFEKASSLDPLISN